MYPLHLFHLVYKCHTYLSIKWKFLKIQMYIVQAYPAYYLSSRTYNFFTYFMEVRFFALSIYAIFRNATKSWNLFSHFWVSRLLKCQSWLHLIKLVSVLLVFSLGQGRRSCSPLVWTKFNPVIFLWGVYLCVHNNTRHFLSFISWFLSRKKIMSTLSVWKAAHLLKIG